MALGRKPSGAYDAAFPVTLADGSTAFAEARVMVDATGAIAAGGGKQETLALITNNVAGAPQSAFGGDYVWSVQGTFGGASVQLQSLGPDGTTYMNIGAAKTAADTTGGTGVGLGSNASVRAVITGGPPTGIYATLSRLP